MDNVINFHPADTKLFTFFEVVDEQGISIWGGEDEGEAVKWLRLNLRDKAKLLVSAWDSPDEDAHLVGQPIDITGIVLHAFKEGLRV